jgi:DNA-binding NtrC family response regulator
MNRPYDGHLSWLCVFAEKFPYVEEGRPGMIPYSIYVVDDEETIRKGIALSLGADYRIRSFPAAEDAIESMQTDRPDLVLLDIRLQGMSGIEALERMKSVDPDGLVIMITASDDIDTVISAMKLGAYDYVVKPIHMEALEVSVRNALESIRLRKEVQLLQEKSLRENLPCFVGESNAIQDVMELVQKVAKSPDTPVLIVGETGTGKEIVAGAIHYKSPHFRGPFVSLNCASLPKDLVESELFGYEKGAFSGASISGKKGLIEEAAEGTLFLDEVGDLGHEAQGKLLRFLETGEFYRLGGTRLKHVRTRVVSATNKDLKDMAEKGLFREDLYYRLAVIRVEVPSLKKRPEDIIPIAKHFLVEFGRKHGKLFKGFSPEVEEFLRSYSWKGNIRELRNVMERGVLVGDGSELHLADLGIEDERRRREAADGIDPAPIPETGIDLQSLHDALDRHYFEEALGMAHSNDAKASQLLHMNYYTFRYRKKQLNIK